MAELTVNFLRLIKYYLILTVSYFTMEVCFRYVHRYFQVMTHRFAKTCKMSPSLCFVESRVCNHFEILL